MPTETQNGNNLKWFEKEAFRLIISQGIFAVLFVILFWYVLVNNSKREQALINTLNSLTPTVQKTYDATCEERTLLVDMRDDIKAIVRTLRSEGYD